MAAAPRKSRASSTIKRSTKKVSNKSDPSAAELATSIRQLQADFRETVESFRRLIGGFAEQANRLAEQSAELSRSLTHSPPANSSVEELSRVANQIALNAAIEAAGADEAGAGFAIIADDVRRLAGRLTQSAAAGAAWRNEKIALQRDICQQADHLASITRQVGERFAVTFTLADGAADAPSLAELSANFQQLRLTIAELPSAPAKEGNAQ